MRNQRISLPKLSGKTETWMTLRTHVIEELFIRFGPYPSGFTAGFMKHARIPNPMSPFASKAANEVKTTSSLRGDYS